MTEKNYSEIEKLQMLLNHWLQHNENHGAEYLKWAQAARLAGNAVAAKHIEEAVELMKKADGSLAKALDSVGGPSQEHHQHHHHE